LGLLPVLYLPPNSRVLVAGPQREVMQEEVSKWKDVSVDTSIPINGADAILLSTEQDPEPWLKHLAPGGIIQVSSTKPEAAASYRRRLRHALGNTLPWRENLPPPLFGVVARQGGLPLKVCRNPPKTASRINHKFLPCLFTFGKDELADLGLAIAAKNR
jgi:hypothetical protein